MSVEMAGLQFLRQVFGGSWITQGIGVAAELGLADLLIDGSKTAAELAEKTHTHGASLYRLLRALAGVGIFAEDEDNRFGLTPLADLLRGDAPASQRAFATMMAGEFCQAWGELLHSVKTGEPGFDKRYRMSFFEYMTQHPDRHEIYDAAMTGVHGGETEPMLDAYDFSPFKTVVDIGGGNGYLLAGILNRHPAIQGTLFDLPAVAERSRPIISDLGLSKRCRTEGGDFFQSVPAGADAYVLRHIIHDWQDEDAITILSRCREAMTPESKLLLVEHVIPVGNAPGFGKWLDLMMLLVNGRERTQAEYEHLFAKAGLTLTRILPTTAEVCVIEGNKA